MIEWIVSSCVLIMAVILIRRIFRDKLRAWVRYSLWGLVLLRLLIPFHIGSSLLSTENVVQSVKKQPAFQSTTEILKKPAISYEQAYDQALQDFLQSGQNLSSDAVIPDYNAPNYTPQTPLEQHTQEILSKSTPAYKLQSVFLWIWCSGMTVIAACFLFANFKFRQHLLKHRFYLSTYTRGLKVFSCEGLDTPCLFGLFTPAIYLLPDEAQDETKKQHILCHELTHYQHLDHIWSLLRCLCLILHWYNPLVWVSAILSRRDSELACDEATIQKLGEAQRHSYGITLLEMTCARRPGTGLMNTATTMTGSKAAIKERVTMIVKKPKLSIIALVIVLLITAAAVGCTFFGANQSELPQLSEEVKSGCTEAWVDFLNLNPNIFAPNEFAKPQSRKDGIRYYGSFTDERGTEKHILFIPIHNYDVCVELDIRGERFSHRSGFVLYLASYYDDLESYLLDGVAYRADSIPKDALKKALEIHQQYETMIYGSVLKDTTPKNETEAKLQAEAAFTAWSSYRLAGVCEQTYGIFDGYSVILYTTGPQAIETKTIGVESFSYPCCFVLSGYKDGKFYNIDTLYRQGDFSDESLSKLAKLHQLSSPPTENSPSTQPPEPLFTPVLSNLADADFDSLSYRDTMRIESAMEDNPLLEFFLQPYYDRPEDFPLYSILVQYPNGEKLTTQSQFQAMVDANNGAIDISASYTGYVNRVWIISGVHLRDTVERYLGITIEQLSNQNMANQNVIYSKETDSYYCILGDTVPTEHKYAIDNGFMHKKDTAILSLYDRDNNTNRTAVLYAKGDQWCFYANRPFLRTQPSHPTDPTASIQIPMVVHNGIRYEFSEEYRYHWITNDSNEVATVATENNQSIPTQELHAAQLPAGTKLYATKDNGLTLYAVRTDGRIYRLERAAGYEPTLENEPLAYFQKLFRDDRWMNLIGLLEFQNPSEFHIGYLCATDLPDAEPITQEERNFLEELWGHKIETDLQRMPADILRDAVQKYLGLNFDQIPTDQLPTYNPATDCYYTNYNGAEGLLDTFTVKSVTVNNDTVQVILDIWQNWSNLATLQITEDGYRFISVETA